MNELLTSPASALDEDRLYEHYKIVADPKQSARRIDKFLIDRLPSTTRTKIQLAIKHGLILVNQHPTKANYKIRPHDVIQVVLPTPPRVTDIQPEAIPLSIVYEDESVLVVDKPAYMVVHPAHSNWTGTLVNALVYHFQHLPHMPGNEGRPGLVHRIDKGTSGLLVIAKTEESITALAKQFYEHTISRTYYALVWGIPAREKGTIDVPIGRSPKDRRLMIAYPEGNAGKRAVTHYKVIARYRYVSLVECTLETGRTHQIRAHMKYMGHPIFGDTRYGGEEILQGPRFSKYKAFIGNCLKRLPRQALHAKTLGFIHPTRQEFMEFNAELPEDFSAVLEKWQRYTSQTEF